MLAHLRKCDKALASGWKRIQNLVLNFLPKAELLT